mgnify:CR=1 FL=1
MKAFSSAEDAFFDCIYAGLALFIKSRFGGEKASFGGRLESGVQAVRSSNNFNWKFFCSGEVRPALFPVHILLLFSVEGRGRVHFQLGYWI